MKHIQPAQALQILDTTGALFAKVFEHGSLVVEIYRPVKIDHQQPHHRDEVYVILTGKGFIQIEDQVSAIDAGDVIFVPAGKNHFFFDFSEDFSTWVIFYGPDGGETNHHTPQTLHSTLPPR